MPYSEVPDNALAAPVAGLLRQMVSNLLDNAIRYAKGVVTVTVARAANGEATIRVSDDGDGIPLGHQTRIFDRFVRMSPRASGAGLGLSIARWIAGIHQADLRLARSDAGENVFSVTFQS